MHAIGIMHCLYLCHGFPLVYHYVVRMFTSHYAFFPSMLLMAAFCSHFWRCHVLLSNLWPLCHGFSVPFPPLGNLGNLCFQISFAVWLDQQVEFWTIGCGQKWGCHVYAWHRALGLSVMAYGRWQMGTAWIWESLLGGKLPGDVQPTPDFQWEGSLCCVQPLKFQHFLVTATWLNRHGCITTFMAQLSLFQFLI